MRKVKPLNDFIFKKIFGEKGNEDILISFINAVLKRTHKEPIVEIEIIENKEVIFEQCFLTLQNNGLTLLIKIKGKQLMYAVDLVCLKVLILYIKNIKIL